MREHGSRLGHRVLVEQVLAKASASALRVGHEIGKLLDRFNLLFQVLLLQKVAALCVACESSSENSDYNYTHCMLFVHVTCTTHHDRRPACADRAATD